MILHDREARRKTRYNGYAAELWITFLETKRQVTALINIRQR